jgi:hypothetical protein
MKIICKLLTIGASIVLTAASQAAAPSAIERNQFTTTPGLALTNVITLTSTNQINLLKPVVASDHITLGTAGKGIKIKEGTNGRMGVALLASGAASVVTTNVGTTSRIFLQHQTAGGTLGILAVSARTNAVGFAISSSQSGETNAVAWLIIDPSP